MFHQENFSHIEYPKKNLTKLKKGLDQKNNTQVSTSPSTANQNISAQTATAAALLLSQQQQQQLTNLLAAAANSNQNSNNASLAHLNGLNLLNSELLDKKVFDLEIKPGTLLISFS